MKTPRYLIAKYVPDLRRMEPRNIGVIVWTPGAMDARFVAEKLDRPGQLDGRSIPSFVTSADALRQWVGFWRREIEKPEIEPVTGGTRVARSSPEFLSALMSGNRGNFQLVEGGFLLDPLEPEELPALADHLYGTLVEATGYEEPRDPSLDEVCEQLIRETDLDVDPRFRRRYEVDCPLAERVDERFEFSYGYGKGAHIRLYQRLPIPKLPRQNHVLHKNVNDAAWKFSCVVRAGLITKDGGGVLVNPTGEQKDDLEIERAFRVLATVTRVLDLSQESQYQALREEFANLSMDLKA
ncbi:MAG: hypothetical protein ACLQGP_28995 [Isosphaeraceae bacterium]